jgi:hypothetical protein
LALSYLAEKHDAAELVLEHDEHREEALDILQVMLSRSDDQSGLEAETIKQLQAMIQLRSGTAEEVSQLVAGHRESRGDYINTEFQVSFDLKQTVGDGVDPDTVNGVTLALNYRLELRH